MRQQYNWMTLVLPLCDTMACGVIISWELRQACSQASGHMNKLLQKSYRMPELTLCADLGASPHWVLQ